MKLNLGNSLALPSTLSDFYQLSNTLIWFRLIIQKKIKSLKWVDFALIWEESFEINGSGDKYWNSFHCTNGELYHLYLNCFQKEDNTSKSIAEIKGRSNYHGSNGVPLLALKKVVKTMHKTMIGLFSLQRLNNDIKNPFAET